MMDKKTMKNKDYDEYQMMVRYKYGYYALFLLIGLIVTNQFIVAFHVWASPFLQTLVMLYIVGIYLITMYIFKNAYIGKKERSPFRTIAYMGFVGVINFAYIILLRPDFPFYKDNHLQDNIGTLLAAIFFSYISVILFINYYINKKKEEE